MSSERRALLEKLNGNNTFEIYAKDLVKLTSLMFLNLLL